VVHAVRGIDVSITLGETVALLGPNGAGKSTTIDMLLGLSRPDAGTISLLGGSPADAVAGGRVGAMLQTGALIRDVSPRELLELMASLHPAPLPVAEALELVGLTEIADRRTHKLSGGQAQRVRFPLGSTGVLHDIAQFLPSYWLVSASHVSLGGPAWSATGWVVLAAWTAVLTLLARFAYRRDTGRV
jgi:ABC-type uncharacterized transport system ATPase subunit